MTGLFDIYEKSNQLEILGFHQIKYHTSSALCNACLSARFLLLHAIQLGGGGLNCLHNILIYATMYGERTKIPVIHQSFLCDT